MIKLENVVWQEGEYFVAQCLNVNVSSFGETKVKALFNLNEALELYFEDVKTDTISIINQPEIVHSTFVHA